MRISFTSNYHVESSNFRWCTNATPISRLFPTKCKSSFVKFQHLIHIHSGNLIYKPIQGNKPRLVRRRRSKKFTPVAFSHSRSQASRRNSLSETILSIGCVLNISLGTPSVCSTNHKANILAKLRRRDTPRYFYAQSTFTLQPLCQAP